MCGEQAKNDINESGFSQAMLCLIALFVFSVLGIFSVKYRALAKQAFTCVFLKIQLRPCDTGLDQKIKIKIVGKVFKHHKGFAKLINNHFQIVSWFFTILFISSMLYTSYGMYNLFVHGTCDPGDPEGCMFTGLVEPETCAHECADGICTCPEGECTGQLGCTECELEQT